MTISISGTGITYNDSSVQTTNGALQLLSNVSGVSTVSQNWNTIPAASKRIQVHIYNANSSNGPVSQYVAVYNSGGTAGTVNGIYTQLGGGTTAQFTAQNNLFFQSAYPTIGNGVIVDIIFVANNTGTYYYMYNCISMTNNKNIAGTISVTGGITQVTIGATPYAFSGLTASVYYEL